MTTEQINQEITEIKEWLIQHDYIAIKYVCGEYIEDDTTWCWYIEERAKKKDRLKYLLSLL
jgi:hypothetical protein